MRPETIAIRTQTKRSSFQENAVPLYLTSSYVFEDAEDMRAQFAEEKEGQLYSRYANPNVQEFIDKLVFLEGGDAGWATASGMAAVFTVFGALLSHGDHIVASKSLFGSTLKLLQEVLPKWGITTSFVDGDDYQGYRDAITPSTVLVYLETPSNPALDIVDLQKVGAICKENDLLFVVDNCFATPILQQPIKFGADVVIHSATKYIDGQGRTLGGAIVSSTEIIEQVKGFARHTGPAMSPFNAWVLSKSIETLPLRMEKHSSSALEIASRLEGHPEVDVVRHPFLESHPSYKLAQQQMNYGGGIIAFQLKGGLEGGRKFLDRLTLFSLTANLGDTRSIATHPASTTHSKLRSEQREEIGITDGLVRLSIGLEHVDDLWEDLVQALDAK